MPLFLKTALKVECLTYYVKDVLLLTNKKESPQADSLRIIY
jgi:hypothetical protein